MPDSFQAAIELVGKRWTGAIVDSLNNGNQYFKQIAQSVPGISDRMLTVRLNQLTEAGVVVHEGPSYHLTYKGTDLMWMVEAAKAWTEKWSDT